MEVEQKNREYTQFETEIAVRPSDIDMNQHVHYAKYLEYLLMARFDQMEKDYKMPMEVFIDMGYTWVAGAVHIEFKRGLKLGESVIVKTRLDSFSGASCRVKFVMHRKTDMKMVTEGYADYTMVSIKSGRPVRVTQDIIDKFTI